MKKERSKMFWVVILFLGTAGALWGIVSFQKRTALNSKPLPTYFVYTEEELNSLRSLKSDAAIQKEDLRRWEERAFETVSAAKSDATFASKFYAYLMVAQRDAAYLSWNAHGQFRGSLDPVSTEVLCLFFAESCGKIPAGNQDDYSKILAKIVLTRVQERMAEDKKKTQSYETEPGDVFWSGKAPFKGIDTGSWKTWLITSVQEFRLAPPPDHSTSEGLKRLEAVKDIFSSLTDKQKSAIAFWAGGPGTKTPPGLWLKEGNNIIKKTGVSLERALLIRSLLAMGIADTEISAMDSKYTYWAKRPFMLDPTILTFMPTPNHPSYPSDSIAIAGFSAQLLSHFFPEEKEKWNAMAEEAANSRIWSGIHFPIDVEQGLVLGRNIAGTVMRRTNSSSR